MAITRYEPFSVLNQMQHEISDFFRQNGNRSTGANGSPAGSIAGDWMPTVDIHEEKDAFVITADIPGVDPQDVQIYMDNGVLSIKGERRLERKENEADFKLQEISYGSFERRFLMPDTADADNIHAKGRNGNLTVTIGKKPSAKPKLIKIDADK